MDNIYIGEIRMHAGTFVPKGWLECNGQKLQVRRFNRLYSLIGNTYGGDNMYFNLPNFSTRIPIGAGKGENLTTRELGTVYGEEKVQLTIDNIPQHTHQLMATTSDADGSDPNGSMISGSNASFADTKLDFKAYSEGPANCELKPCSMKIDGDPAEPHSNIMPSTVVRYIIAFEGEYPEFND